MFFNVPEHQLRRGQPGGWLLSFARPKESNQRKGRPGSPALRAPLRYSTRRAAAELALRAQTVLAEFSRRICVARRLTGGLLASSVGNVRNRALQIDCFGVRRLAAAFGSGQRLAIKPPHSK